MRKVVSSDLFPCPGYFEGLVGKVGGSKEWPNGSSQPQPPPPSQVTQWPYCTRPVASPTWQGLHGTSSGGPCFSSRRRAERPASCRCWRESRYLLEKGAPVIIDGGCRGPAGSGTGSKACKGLLTQPGQHSGRLQCHCPSSACLIVNWVPPIVGDRAAHSGFFVTLVNKLIWNDPNW